MTREQFVAFEHPIGRLAPHAGAPSGSSEADARTGRPFGDSHIFFQQQLRLACPHLRKHAAASGKTKLAGLKCESMRLHCGFSVQLLFQVQLLWKQHLQQSGLS